MRPLARIPIPLSFSNYSSFVFSAFHSSTVWNFQRASEKKKRVPKMLPGRYLSTFPTHRGLIAFNSQNWLMQPFLTFFDDTYGEFAFLRRFNDLITILYILSLNGPRPTGTFVPKMCLLDRHTENFQW